MLRGVKPNLVRQNLNRILELLKEKKIAVLLAGMISQNAFGEEYKKEFDKIYVFREGMLEGSGSFEYLSKNNKYFMNMLEDYSSE